MVKETAYIQLPCHLFLAPLFQERVLKQGFGNQPFVMSPRERCLSKVSENCIFLMVFYEAGRATTNPSCLYLCPRWSHLSVFRPLHWLETQSGLSWCLLQPWLFPALRPLLLHQESSPGKETIIVHCKYQLWNGLIFRPFPWFWLCRRGKHLTCAEASFDNFSNSSLAAASLSSHNSFWDRTCELQWVLQMCRKKKLPTNDKTHFTASLRDFDGRKQSWRCISHVKGEFVVEGFYVALATLQFLLKLSKVIGYLIQLPWTQETCITFKVTYKGSGLLFTPLY